MISSKPIHFKENSKKIQGLYDMPDDILLEIFSHLRCEDVVSVKQVDNRMREITEYPCLWTRIVFEPDLHMTDFDIAEILYQVPMLQTFIIDKRGVGVFVRKAILRCTRLKKLEFNECQTLSEEYLEELLECCMSIVYLSIPEETLYTLKKVEIIAKFSRLHTLILRRRSPKYILPSPVLLKPIIDGCKELKRFDLVYENAFVSDLVFVLDLSKLRNHSLCMRLSTEVLGSISPPWFSHTVAKTLLIEVDCEADFYGAFRLFRKFKRLISLAFDDLAYENLQNVMDFFRDNDTNDLVEVAITLYKNYEDRLADIIVNNCPKLKKLHFIGCSNLTDNSLKNLYKLPNLQFIDLEAVEITDDGVLHLRKCRKLHYLGLGYCTYLTETTMNLLMEFSALRALILDKCDTSGLPVDMIPEKLKDLKILSVDGCCNSRQIANKLRETMPDVRVYYGFGYIP